MCTMMPNDVPLKTDVRYSGKANMTHLIMMWLPNDEASFLATAAFACAAVNTDRPRPCPLPVVLVCACACVAVRVFCL